MGEKVFSGLVGIYLFRQLWGIQGKKFTLEAFMEGKADFLTSLLLLLFRICFWGIQGGKFNFEASREESSIKHTRRTFFYLSHSGRESWLEGNSIMRHPGRKVLLSIQGGHFLFEAFREGKLVLKHPSRGFLFILLRNSVFKHPRRRILLMDLRS